MKSKLSDQDVTTILRQYRAGRDVEEIGNEFFISGSHVRGIAQAHRVRRKNMDQKEIRNQKIVSGFISGKSTADLKREYSMSRHYIRTILHAAGIELSRPKVEAPVVVTDPDNYDPTNNYALAGVEIHTENVYAYRMGYELTNTGDWNRKNGLTQRPFAPGKIGAKK